MSSSFDAFLTETATTLRLPDMTGVRGGDAVEHLASFAIMPLLPASAEVQLHSNVEMPYILWETFADGNLDIKQGDTLIVPATIGDPYAIRGVEVWPYQDSTYVHLIVEKLRE